MEVHLSFAHDEGVLADFEGHTDILFNEQNRQAFALESLQGMEELEGEHRGEAEGQLVDHEDLRFCHDPAGYGEHLLFAAAHGPGALFGAFFEPWEQLEDLGQIGTHAGAGAFRCRTHLEVLTHGHVAEELAAFRHHDHAELCLGMRRQSADVFALEGHGAFPWSDLAHDRAEQRRFPGTVGTHQRREPALFHGEVETPKDL